MTYRSKTILEIREMNFVLNQGGLGDAIAQLPAIKYSLDFHPQVLINLWVHDYFVPIAEKAFSTYKNIKVISLMKANELYDDKLPARSPYAHRISNLSWHLTDHAFATIVGRDVKSEYKNYLSIEPIDVDNFELPEKYVVVTTAYTSDTRVWNVKSVNETVEYIISKGYVPVFLGKSFAPAYKNVGLEGKFTEVDYTKGLNLIDDTSLLEAHGIMAKAKVVVGLDNGLLHLCALTETPIVYGFTSVSPEHRLPYRKNELGWNCFVVQPPKEVKCRGCQSNFNFADEKVDFRFCPYGDYICIDSLESKLWIEQLEKVL